MNPQEQMDKIEHTAKLLETAYLKGVTPWGRSGVGLHHSRSEEYWRAVRIPVANMIDRDGSVLDIGCANGYLLECLQLWLGERRINIEPFGLDISSVLLDEAENRVPQGSFYHANVWGWKAPRKYDFVLTELEYVPEEGWRMYLDGLIQEAVADDGRLIVSRYSSDASKRRSLVDDITSLGLNVERVEIGNWEGIQKTETLSITK